MNVSVIIPSYNRAHTLGRCLDSVLAQSYAASEVIVVDDGSSDETTLLLQAYPQVSVLTHSENKGVSAARNSGIARAKCDWIALLDSDDSWDKEKLAQQMDAVKQNPQFRIFHTDERWIRQGIRVNPKKKHAKPDGWIFSHCLALCCVSPSSVLIHRSILDVVGGFDESLPACEDYDLWLRIFHRYPVRLISMMLVTKYGGHADQLSQQFWGMDRFRVHALSKLLEGETLSRDDRALTLAMLQQKCSVLAQGANKRDQLDRAAFYTNLPNQYRLLPA